MNRQKDLDIIAPDDPIIDTSNTSIPTDNQPTTSTPIVKAPSKKKKKYYQQEDKIEGLVNKTRSQFANIAKPKNFTFEECDAEEEIIVVLRPHWFVNIRWMFLCFIFLMTPSIIAFINQHVFSNTLFFGFFTDSQLIPQNYKNISMIFWYLFIFIFAFESFLSWYFDVYIVTNKRVVDIHFNNLLDKKFSEANIEDIQDVTSRISGLSQTIFNYGDILIQTAGAVSLINFSKVPQPTAVTEIIQELRQEIREKHREETKNE